MTGIELFDKKLEFYITETTSMCNMYYIESSSSVIEKIIDRIKRVLKEIKRKISQVITSNDFYTKKENLTKAMKRNRLLGFKMVNSYDLGKALVICHNACNDIRTSSGKDDVHIEKYQELLDNIHEQTKSIKFSTVIRNIDISKYVTIMDDIDDEIDSLNKEYNKLMKNEEENQDNIELVVEKLRAYSTLSNMINMEISKQLQFASMIIKYSS